MPLFTSASFLVFSRINGNLYKGASLLSSSAAVVSIWSLSVSVIVERAGGSRCTKKKKIRKVLGYLHPSRLYIHNEKISLKIELKQDSFY